MMGKLWKQKTNNSCDEPIKYKWSLQYYTLKEIITFFKLPIVVQCEEKPSSVLLENFFFDLQQPLLLYSKRFTRKAEAKCLQKLPNGRYDETKLTVVIPELYDGWFKISRQMDFEKPSPHYSIESLMHSGSDFFLCVEEFCAICTESTDAKDPTVERAVSAGEVFRKTGLHTINNLLALPTQKSDGVNATFLMCIDENDVELLVPLNQTGVFYEVSDGNLDRNNCLIQIGYVIEEIEEFPVYLRHVLGEPPLLAQNYTPYLKLVRVIEEEILMAATLQTDSLFPLEIQSNSPIRFRIALNTGSIISSNEYLKAMELCKSVEDTYVKDIKFAFTMYPPHAVVNAFSNPSFTDELASNRSSQQTTASNGTNVLETESGEDLVDIDANSEFSIDWNPLRTNKNTNTDRQMPELETSVMLSDSFTSDEDHASECSFISSDLATSHIQTISVDLSDKDRCFCEKHLQRRVNLSSKELRKAPLSHFYDSADTVFFWSQSLSRESTKGSSSGTILPSNSHRIIDVPTLDIRGENNSCPRENADLFDSIPVRDMEQRRGYGFNRTIAGDANSSLTESENTIAALTAGKITERNTTDLPELTITNLPLVNTLIKANENTVHVRDESSLLLSLRSSLPARSSGHISFDRRPKVSGISGFHIATFDPDIGYKLQDYKFVKTVSLPLLSFNRKKQTSISVRKSSSWEGLVKLNKKPNIESKQRTFFPGYNNMYSGSEDLHFISGDVSEDYSSEKEYEQNKRKAFTELSNIVGKKLVNVDTHYIKSEQTESQNRMKAIILDGNYPCYEHVINNHTHDNPINCNKQQMPPKKFVESLDAIENVNLFYENEACTNDGNSSSENLLSTSSNRNVCLSGKIARTLCQSVRRKNEIKTMCVEKGVWNESSDFV